MDEEDIKQMLEDAGLCLQDAGKRWPKYPDVVRANIKAALVLINEVYPIIFQKESIDE